jgi:sulfur-oxidizing protein SoxY
MTSASSPPSSIDSTRRKLLAAGASLGAVVMVRPVFAAPDELAAAIDAYTGGAKINSGRVDFDIAKLVDNGNTVPVTVTVDSPMPGPRPLPCASSSKRWLTAALM